MRSGTLLASAALALALGLVITTACAEVVAVVSSKSAMTTLSKAQVIDIFLGKTTRLPDGTPVTPIDQTEGSPARDEFYAAYAGKSPAQVKSLWAKIIFTGRGQPPKSVSSDAAVRLFIAVHPQAISYIDRSAVDATVKILTSP